MSKRVNYRGMWQDAYGSIPKDSDGRSYEIHHIDNNRQHNALWNFECLSIQEHYNRHLEHGDWRACQQIAKRMKLSPELISELSSLAAKELVANRTHNFLGSALQRKRIAAGTHAGTKVFAEIHTCPRCGKIGKGAIMFRWHFANCKKTIINSIENTELRV